MTGGPVVIGQQGDDERQRQLGGSNSWTGGEYVCRIALNDKTAAQNGCSDSVMQWEGERAREVMMANKLTWPPGDRLGQGGALGALGAH